MENAGNSLGMEAFAKAAQLSTVPGSDQCCDYQSNTEFILFLA